MFDKLLNVGVEFDLAINTLSFSEMTEKQLRYYGDGLSCKLGQNGMLFEQNQDDRSAGTLYSKLILPDYFKFRRNLGISTLPGLTEGMADIWANRAIPDILGQENLRLNNGVFLRTKNAVRRRINQVRCSGILNRFRR
jgi:hypothetical protein